VEDWSWGGFWRGVDVAWWISGFVNLTVWKSVKKLIAGPRVWVTLRERRQCKASAKIQQQFNIFRCRMFRDADGGL
jgi:hypothetical protein